MSRGFWDRIFNTSLKNHDRNNRQKRRFSALLGERHIKQIAIEVWERKLSVQIQALQTIIQGSSKTKEDFYPFGAIFLSGLKI